MLYTLIGNGTANKKETLASLRSLHKAAEASGDEFWMLLRTYAEPSETTLSVLSWLTAEGIYYETVEGPETGDAAALYVAAVERHKAKRPTVRAITLTPMRVLEGEQYAVLILSDDIDGDYDVLYAINAAIEADIAVYDLGGQMTPLTIEPEPLESPTEFTLEQSADDPSDPMPEPEVDFTREDLMTLTHEELKALVTSRGLTPKDMRSRETLITALLEGVVSEDTPTEVVSAPKGLRFYLMVVNTDGAAELRPLTSEQAALVV